MSSEPTSPTVCQGCHRPPEDCTCKRFPAYLSGPLCTCGRRLVPALAAHAQNADALVSSLVKGHSRDEILGLVVALFGVSLKRVRKVEEETQALRAKQQSAVESLRGELVAARACLPSEGAVVEIALGEHDSADVRALFDGVRDALNAMEAILRELTAESEDPPEPQEPPVCFCAKGVAGTCPCEVSHE
jgi:hypothetical protein